MKITASSIKPGVNAHPSRVDSRAGSTGSAAQRGDVQSQLKGKRMVLFDSVENVLRVGFFSRPAFSICSVWLLATSRVLRTVPEHTTAALCHFACMTAHNRK